MNKEEAISYLLERGVLVGPDELERLKDFSEENLKAIILRNSQETQDNAPVLVVDEYLENPGKITVSDFVGMFNNRYDELSRILRNRVELNNVVSINRAQLSSQKNTAVIGIVLEKSLTKNGFIILKIEDQTGVLDVVIGPEKQEIYAAAQDVVEDEVLGFAGSIKQKTLFAASIYFPDIPFGIKFKKSPEEEYLAVLGDIHFGSKYFLKKDFEKFLLWINGILGNEEQKHIASKVKYLVITGDMVEGVGVYPSQEEDLEINDVREQYEQLTALLKKIPQRIKIIMLAGNHDACRLQEPQPPIIKAFSKALWQLPNVVMASNPCLVNIARKKDFEGFDMLLYHGYSLIYYSEHVASIRDAGGQKRADLIMKYLLQKRHLAPTHSSVTYLPSSKDPLIIRRVPDIFITGHIHRVSYANYKHVTLINSSTWSDITEDQIKRGLEPQPSKLAIVNLNTRAIRIMNFYKKQDKEG